MRCVFSVNNSGIFSSVVVEKDKVYLLSNNEKQVLDINSKTCFNTLISLYSLKESWKRKECIDVKYKINFDNELYKFDGIDVPDNFYMFVAYINRLVGESI